MKMTKTILYCNNKFIDGLFMLLKVLLFKFMEYQTQRGKDN